MGQKIEERHNVVEIVLILFVNNFGSNRFSLISHKFMEGRREILLWKRKVHKLLALTVEKHSKCQVYLTGWCMITYRVE